MDYSTVDFGLWYHRLSSSSDRIKKRVTANKRLILMSLLMPGPCTRAITFVKTHNRASTAAGGGSTAGGEAGSVLNFRGIEFAAPKRMQLQQTSQLGSDIGQKNVRAFNPTYFFYFSKNNQANPITRNGPGVLNTP